MQTKATSRTSVAEGSKRKTGKDRKRKNISPEAKGRRKTGIAGAGAWKKGKAKMAGAAQRRILQWWVFLFFFPLPSYLWWQFP
jgi:hypothetical protein